MLSRLLAVIETWLPPKDAASTVSPGRRLFSSLVLPWLFLHLPSNLPAPWTCMLSASVPNYNLLVLCLICWRLWPSGHCSSPQKHLCTSSQVDAAVSTANSQLPGVSSAVISPRPHWELHPLPSHVSHSLPLPLQLAIDSNAPQHFQPQEDLNTSLLPCQSLLLVLFQGRFCGIDSFFKKFLFIYFWLRWVFVAVCGLSLVAASGGYSSLRCAGFSLQWLLLLRSTGSRRAGSVVVAHGL